MSDPFGVPGLEFIDDERLRGHRPTSAASQPKPARTPPPPAPEQRTETRPEPRPVADEGGDSWMERILAGQPWYANPQVSFTSLVDHARHGDWTLSNGPRYARLAWLWLPAMAARVGSWSILRVWMRDRAPRLSEEQPAIRALIAEAREYGPRTTAFVCGIYVPVRIASVIADYAGRTGVAVLLAWLVANSVNPIPVIGALAPDWVTVDFWWQATVDTPGGQTSTPASFASAAGAVVGKVTGSVLLAALGLWVVRGWWRNRGNDINKGVE